MSKVILTIILLLITISCRYPKVKVVTDIPYIKDTTSERQMLDIYVPSGVKDAPVVLLVHGGAWRMGSKSSPEFVSLARRLSREGIVVVVMNYRLSPQYKHPSHIEDVAAAFSWAKANISKYGGSGSNIFISGHSAGGHLVALLALDKRYLAKYNLSPKDIAGVIPISGPMVININRMQASQDWYRDAFDTDTTTWREVSPIYYANPDAPRFLFICGEKDFDIPVSSSKELSRRLKEEYKIESRVVILPNYSHMMTIINASKGKEFEEILNFIKPKK